MGEADFDTLGKLSSAHRWGGNHPPGGVGPPWAVGERRSAEVEAENLRPTTQGGINPPWVVGGRRSAEVEEWPPTTQGGIYSPLSGGSETLLYLLCAPPPPPLTHRSGGTHPPWGVGPPPAVGRAQFPHSYKQISTPPPPIPLITVATAMQETKV